MSHHPLNTPGAPADPPHQTPERDGDVTPSRPGPHTAREGDHRQTGSHTSPHPAREVADPHPSDEADPYNERPPGSASPHAAGKANPDIGPNPARHTGTAPPRPHNVGSGAE